MIPAPTTDGDVVVLGDARMSSREARTLSSALLAAASRADDFAHHAEVTAKREAVIGRLRDWLLAHGGGWIVSHRPSGYGTGGPVLVACPYSPSVEEMTTTDAGGVVRWRGDPVRTGALIRQHGGRLSHRSDGRYGTLCGKSSYMCDYQQRDLCPKCETKHTKVHVRLGVDTSIVEIVLEAGCYLEPWMPSAKAAP